jgi:gamma-glutamylcyclotransferase (GGCT)/AIG2-like uncharacterized protein YtfP
MPNKIKILVYGTLREGQYNFDRIINNYGLESIKKVSEKILKGFQMITIHDWYPAIIYTNKEEDVIIVEEMEVTPEAKDFIDRMESGAGYSIMNINGADIYYMTQNTHGEKAIIKSGDWVKYISK